MLLTGDTTPYVNFTDTVSLSFSAKNAIAVMVKNELMKATSGKLFTPLGNVSRAELAKIIYQSLYLK